MPWIRKRSPLLLCLLGLGALAAVPASAVDATKPTACTANHFNDPSGDQELIGLQGFGPTSSTAENLDVKGLFFNFKDGKLTANIQVANLTTEVPDPTVSNGGVYYYVIYLYGDAVKFVAAHNTGSAIDYEFGTIDPDVGTYTTEGTTPGAFFEGADGVVQLEVPAEIGGKAGETLKGVVVNIDGIDVGTDHGNGLNNHADVAPDDSSNVPPDGKDYKVADCPAAGAAPAPAAPSTPSAPAPPATPQGGSPGPAPAADTTLPIKFAGIIGKAKKAKKGKKLSFKATAGKPIRGLKLTLKKLGGKGATLATGKAASVKAGSVKVSLKLKKKLKKGAYTLLATGTVDGKKLSYGQKVGVR